MTEELDDNVGRAEDFGPVGGQFRAFFHVFLVRIARGLAGAGFDEHIEARFFQVRDYGRNQRDAAFFRINLPGYAKDHAPSFQKAFELDAEISRLVVVFLLGLPRIRTLLSGCKLQLRLLFNVIAESGAERVPLFWERLLSWCSTRSTRNVPHRNNSEILSLMSRWDKADMPEGDACERCSTHRDRNAD